jgi:hypothetical protein
MPTMTKKDTKTAYRSRISAQNIMEGDQFILRGEPNIFVEKVTRNEDAGVVTVSFDDGTKRRFDWNDKISIVETPERNLFRRNSLRRNGYPNYFDYAYGY